MVLENRVSQSERGRNFRLHPNVAVNPLHKFRGICLEELRLLSVCLNPFSVCNNVATSRIDDLSGCGLAIEVQIDRRTRILARCHLLATGCVKQPLESQMKAVCRAAGVQSVDKVCSRQKRFHTLVGLPGAVKRRTDLINLIGVVFSRQGG